MTLDFAALKRDLEGRVLPGDSITIEPLENVSIDAAVRSDGGDSGIAHPIWFVVASLRGLGIDVKDLCVLAQKAENDTFLYGGVDIESVRALHVGHTYDVTAEITSVSRKATRDGSTLDTIDILCRISDSDSSPVGSVTSTYLFKRAMIPS